MKAIFLIRDNPEPPVNGYKKRNYYLIDYLKSKGVEVSLFITENKQETRKKILLFFISLFSNIPFSVRIRTSAKIKQDLEQLCSKNKYDLIICDGFHRALNIPFDVPSKKILYDHNIESEIARRYAHTEKNLLKKIFAYLEYLKFKQLQKKLWPKFDHCVACSALDKKIIERANPNTIVADNGVDLESFKTSGIQAEPDTLIYTGQIGWYPNEDALIYFAEQILPAAKKAIPSLKLWIVGANPSKRIKELSLTYDNIAVTGFVKDITEFISKATAVIVPLRIGGGTRIKILEALSMEKAVISTSIGAEGLDVQDNENILIRDNPKEFAQAVVEVLKNSDLREKLGENGRRLVEEKYDWKKVFKELDPIIKQ